MGYFVAGILIGSLVGYLLYLSIRRRMVRIDEEKQMLQQERQIVVEFMHNLVEAIGEGVDRPELFRRIVHAAILSTGALSACLFERTESGKLRGAAVEGLFPPTRPLPASSREKLATRAKFIEQVLKSESFEMGDGLIGSVARSGKAVLIEDASQDPRITLHDDPALAVRSMIVTPILFRKKVLGVLAVANPADGMSFNETDFSLVESLAEQAAMAIHNTDLMALQLEKSKIDFDLSLASNIQGMLLPHKYPEDPRLDIAACYQPAQKIGGDLYNVFALGGNRFGVAIADVSGKGVPASLLMAICQTNLRHFALVNESPAAVMRAMNKEMEDEVQEDMFVTAVYGVIDLDRNTFTFARAGHELPLIVRSGGPDEHPSARFWGGEGMALGMVPSEVFDMVLVDVEVPLAPGDTIVLYTDGVTEAAGADDQEFSSNRLADVALTLRDRPAVDINAGILASVERFGGTRRLADDFTLITVKRKEGIVQAEPE